MNMLRRFLAFILTFAMVSTVAIPAIAVNIENNLQGNTRSAIPDVGPIDGFLEGNTVRRTRSGNIKDATAAVAVLTSLSNLDPIIYATVIGVIANALVENGAINNIYHERTEYHRSDGMDYYYKYTYYSDSAYKNKIGELYSYVYTKWY